MLDLHQPKRYFLYSEKSILIEWNQEISTALIPVLSGFKKTIENYYLDRIYSVTTAYNAVLVLFKNNIEKPNERIEELQELFKTIDLSSNNESKLWRVPVCYDPILGWDIEHLAKLKSLTVEGVIERHASVEYTVFFMGFLPGFLYLGGLLDCLHTPRLATPRLEIKAGSVAIGGAQTGIYPVVSPGGWHIIGNTPQIFFNPKKTPPAPFLAGDRLKFNPISYQDFINY